MTPSCDFIKGQAHRQFLLFCDLWNVFLNVLDIIPTSFPVPDFVISIITRENLNELDVLSWLLDRLRHFSGIWESFDVLDRGLPYTRGYKFCSISTNDDNTYFEVICDLQHKYYHCQSHTSLQTIGCRTTVAVIEPKLLLGAEPYEVVSATMIPFDPGFTLESHNETLFIIPLTNPNWVTTLRIYVLQF